LCPLQRVSAFEVRQLAAAFKSAAFFVSRQESGGKPPHCKARLTPRDA